MVKSRQRGVRLEEVSFHFHGRPAALVECVALPRLYARSPPASWGGLQILRFHIWLVITAGQHQHLVDFHRMRCQAGSVMASIAARTGARWWIVTENPTPAFDSRLRSLCW